MGETRTTKLRCKPGDLARIRKAWNRLLEGRLVFVRRAYSKTEWVVCLLDGPAFTLGEDCRRYIATRNLIADDWALEPLVGEHHIPRAERATGLGAPEVHSRLEACEASI